MKCLIISVYLNFSESSEITENLASYIVKRTEQLDYPELV